MFSLELHKKCVRCFLFLAKQFPSRANNQSLLASCVVPKQDCDILGFNQRN